MDTKAKMAIVDQILTRVAEEVGDITDPTMALYYQRLPDAKELFEYHARGNMGNLEGEMVERALYCLMYWFESPGEIEILLSGSVPHHNDTLNIPPEVYQELLNATAEVVQKTIPPENEEELIVWQELCVELEKIIKDSSQHILK